MARHFGRGYAGRPGNPAGDLIVAETASRRGIAENNAQIANQINPNLAGGVFLDAICALTGLQRQASTFTTVAAVTVTGASGTIIPAGKRAKTSAGDEFQTASQVTIGAGGTATVDFIAVEAGEVPCAANALDTIVDYVLGWETVDNTNAGVVGVESQSDASLRLQRKKTLALQGISIAEAIKSALLALEGVQSIQYRENYTNAPDTIDGIYLVAHSIWVCVNGGTASEIASVLLQNKTAGANWNGAQTENVVDESSGQTYTVKFDRPTQVPIKCRVTVSAGSYTGDLATDVPSAVVAYADGEVDGEEGFSVGNSISPFEIGAAVNAELPGVYVKKVELDYAAGSSWITTELAIDIDEIATITSSAVTVVES